MLSANEHLRQLALRVSYFLLHLGDVGGVRVGIPLVHRHPQVVQCEQYVFTVLKRASHPSETGGVHNYLILFRGFLVPPLRGGKKKSVL